MRIEANQNERVSRYGYLRAQNFLRMIGKSKSLTPQQKATLRGQALHGDLDGAMRGYEKIVTVRES